MVGALAPAPASASAAAASGVGGAASAAAAPDVWRLELRDAHVKLLQRADRQRRGLAVIRRITAPGALAAAIAAGAAAAADGGDGDGGDGGRGAAARAATRSHKYTLLDRFGVVADIEVAPSVPLGERAESDGAARAGAGVGESAPAEVTVVSRLLPALRLNATPESLRLLLRLGEAVGGQVSAEAARLFGYGYGNTAASGAVPPPHADGSSGSGSGRRGRSHSQTDGSPSRGGSSAGGLLRGGWRGAALEARLEGSVRLS
jgi:hypothetical protein